MNQRLLFAVGVCLFGPSVVRSQDPIDDIVGHGCFEAARSVHSKDDCNENVSVESCLCQDDSFLKTVMQCVRHEEDEDEDSITEAKNSVKKYCNAEIGKRMVTNSRMATALKMKRSGDGLSTSSEPSLVVRGKYDGLDPKAVKVLKDSKKKRKKSDKYALRFGWGIIGYIALVALLRSISNFAYKAMPKVLRAFDNPTCRRIRKHTMLPATFGTKHSHPHYIRGFSFNIPTREQSIILSVYVIMNIIFMFVGYQTYDWPENVRDYFPSDKYNSKIDPTKYLQKQLSNRAGILAISQFPLLILFAGRNNFLLWVTGWSLDAFNVFHKWFGRMIVLLLFVHAIAYSIYEGKEKYIEIWEETYWRWGVVGVICACLIVFQSLHYFRSLKYEFFLITHLLLAIFFTVGAWYHLTLLKYYEYVYAGVAVWAFDRFLRLARIFASGVNSKAEVKYHDGDVIELKMSYSKLWKFYPGSYSFIHIMRWNRFWQNHPFTLIESPKPEDEGKLVMFARAKDGFTKHTKEYLQQQGESNNTTVNVLIEGPYGCSHPVHKYDEIVMFAGGIGITGIYCYAQSIRKNSSKNHKIYFNWVIPNTKPLDWFREYLDYLQGDDRFDVQIHINKDRELVEEDPSGSNTELAEEDNGYSNDENEKRDSQSINSYNLKKSYGKPNVYNTVNEHIRGSNGSTAFLVCGPGPMNDEVRKSIAQNIEAAEGRVDYFEESFSW